MLTLARLYTTLSLSLGMISLVIFHLFCFCLSRSCTRLRVRFASYKFLGESLFKIGERGLEAEKCLKKSINLVAEEILLVWLF